jgi:hypothetical protein
MQNKNDQRIKDEVRAEIQALECNYSILSKYLSGARVEELEVVGALHSFKSGLDRASAHILTLYTLEGQKTKITWEQLLNNLNEALDTLKNNYRKLDPRTVIRTALNLAEPNVQEVMAYLSKLKESLK